MKHIPNKYDICKHIPSGSLRFVNYVRDTEKEPDFWGWKCYLDKVGGLTAGFCIQVIAPRFTLKWVYYSFIAIIKYFHWEILNIFMRIYYNVYKKWLRKMKNNTIQY